MVRVLIAEAMRQKRIQRLDITYGRSDCGEGAAAGRSCSMSIRVDDSYFRRAVVLTTGGAGPPARTTNPANATGDGIAMALQRRRPAGYGVRAVSSHGVVPPRAPPSYCPRPCAERGLSSETTKAKSSCRGIIRSRALAPRDIVSRAIWAEMAATKARHVYLDVTHLGAEFVKRRFPTIYATCLRYDIDITRSGSRVSQRPLHDGRRMDGLEWRHDRPGIVCSGRSGVQRRPWANRLASNSLSKTGLWARAATAAVAYAGREEIPSLATHGGSQARTVWFV